MTASDTALSNSALPDPDPVEPASDRGWPETAPPARDRPRAESYRQLWQPPGRRPALDRALDQPQVWAGAGHPAQSDRPERPDQARRPEQAAGVAPAGRAVIGDMLRLPIAWCQSGTCIAWHTDQAALGEADVRARAVAAGWCVDAFGHLICPDCQQRYPVWSTRPLALRASRRVGRSRSAGGLAGRHRHRN